MVSTYEQDFEQRAGRLLQYLKSPERYDRKFLPRPFFFEFTGTPSAGKTTTIHELDKFLRRQGFRVWIPQEGAEVIRHIERTTPEYNIRTGMYAAGLISDHGNGSTYDIVILDRGIFDAYSWMEYWLEKEKLTKPDARSFQKFFLNQFFISKVDGAFIFWCQPEEAMKREQRIALSKKLGETTNPATIQKLIDRYRTVYRRLARKHQQLHMIDTTNMTELEMVEYAARMILEAMELETVFK